MRKETAFSGLEAAIVLIAFVVVAAVFSYVMLGAGFFATQKSQEVTYSGIKQTTSNLVLDGNLYGKHATDGGTVGIIGSLTFWLAIPEGGQAQSMSDVTYLYTETNSNDIVSPVTQIKAYYLTSTATGGFTNGNLLSPGAKVKVTLNTPPLYRPGPSEKFSLEIKPKTGASSIITKTLSSGYVGGEII